MTAPESGAPAEGVSLGLFLESCCRAELEAFYLFWVGSDPVPGSLDDLVQQLRRRMKNPDVVRARMKVFTRPQREVLLAVVAADGFSVPKSAFLQGTLTEAVQPYEADVATRTLRKRGFLAERAPAVGSGSAYAVPRELAEVIRRLFRAADRPPRSLFSLAGFLDGVELDRLTLVYGRFLPADTGPERDAVVRALLEPTALCARFAALEEERFRSFVQTVALQFGGILTRSLFGRINTGGLAWDVASFRQILEGHLLGTACVLNLEAFGIGRVEEGVTLFRETVEALLDVHVPDASRQTRVINLGADLLSDVQRILTFLGRDTVRVTQEGALYKTDRRRLENEMILREWGRLTRERVLDFLMAFLKEHGLIAARGGNVLRPTRDGRRFGRLELETQLRQILKHVLTMFPVESGRFHFRPLVTLLVDRFRALDPEAWIDPMDLPFRTRNDYLAELQERVGKETFPDPYDHALHPPREDPFQMAWRLFDLLTEWFLLLGLVEGSIEGERLHAIRITLLGHRLLGPQDVRESSARRAAPRRKEAQEPGRPALIVNPDFEVLLHPGPDTLEVVYFLDRFCERLHADHHLHFRLDRSRFQDWIGQGGRVESVLETLQASVRTPLPENVVVTLRDWATAVKFVEATQVVLLECANPETLDLVAEKPAVKKALHRRLGPTALALDQRKVGPDLADELRALGIFLR